MKSYLDLIPISAKVRRKQNKMTILCITLSVFLVTSVFSMADMAIRMEEASARRQHGNWHIAIDGITDADAELIAARKDMAAYSMYDAINYRLSENYDVGGKKAAIAGVSESFLGDTFDYMTQGDFPRDETETVISENARDLFGAEIGSRITLQTPAGDFDYTISGFMQDGGSDRYDAILLLVNRAAFDKVRAANDIAPAPTYYFRFRRYSDIRRAINEVKEQLKAQDAHVGENTVMVGLTGFSENYVLQSMYSVAAFLFLLILTAGALMIASSMNSNIAGRTEFFGMLCCTGASRKQIMRLVRWEALYWCRAGIPVGVVLGIAVTWALCAVLRSTVGGTFADIPLFGVSAIGIVCGVLAGLMTVLLSAQSPARRAARVSPATAAAGNAQISPRRGTNGKAFRIKAFKIESLLGIRHAISSPKNLLLMTASFALSIILFLGFAAIHDWVDHALNGHKPHTPDVSVLSADFSSQISRALTAQLGSMEGVRCAAGRSLAKDLPALSDKDVKAVDLISLDEQQFQWAVDEKWSRDKAGLKRALRESDCVMTVYDRDNPLEKGDKIDINGERFEIACVLTDSPISGSGNPSILCTEEIFTRLTKETAYAAVDLLLTKEASENDIRAIRAEADANGFILDDRRAINREVSGTYLAFTLLAYGFLTLIALIAVFHIINSISMSVSARIKQYGIMRSVGMSAGQLTKMIAAETATYTLCGMTVGLAAGLPIHKFFYESFITAYFGEPWETPVAAVIVILAFVLAASAAAVCAPAKQIREMSVADTIHAD